MYKVFFFNRNITFFSIFQNKDHTLVETDCARVTRNSCTGLSSYGFANYTQMVISVLVKGLLGVHTRCWKRAGCSVAVLHLTRESCQYQYVDKMQDTAVRGRRTVTLGKVRELRWSGGLLDGQLCEDRPGLLPRLGAWQGACPVVDSQ